jgi:hypothetical protein
LLFALVSSYEEEQKIVAINSNARYAGVGISDNLTAICEPII